MRDVVLIHLIPVSGGRILTLEAYVVPEILRINNEHVEVLEKDLSHLRNLWFFDVYRPNRSLKFIFWSVQIVFESFRGAKQFGESLMSRLQ